MKNGIMSMNEWIKREHNVTTDDEVSRIIHADGSGCGDGGTWDKYYEEWSALDHRRSELDKATDPGTFESWYAAKNYYTDEQAAKKLQELKESDPAEYERARREFTTWEPKYKRHAIVMELSNDEWKHLGDLASERGQSRGKYLETFVKDLYGERRQGSDEEDLARQWHDRGSCNW